MPAFVARRLEGLRAPAVFTYRDDEVSVASLPQRMLGGLRPGGGSGRRGPSAMWPTASRCVDLRLGAFVR
jgi:hypothetical protein